jgi:hypothetical protein
MHFIPNGMYKEFETLIAKENEEKVFGRFSQNGNPNKIHYIKPL